MTALRASEPRASRRYATRCFRPMRGPTSRSCGARAAASGTTRAASTSISSPGSPSSGSVTARRHPLAAAREQLDRLWHASNLYWTEPMLRLAAPAGRAASRSAGRSSATPVPRRTRRRSRSPARQPAAHGSSRSRAASTAARSAPSRHRPAARSGKASARSLPGVAFAQPNDVESLEAALAPAGDTALAAARARARRGRRDPARDRRSRRPPPSSRSRSARCSASTRCRPGWAGRGRSSPTSSSGSRPIWSPSPRGSRMGCPLVRCSPASGRRPASSPGDHGSTFGGNPVAAAAAVRGRRGDRRDLLANVRERGAQLRPASRPCPAVRASAVAGCSSGAELDRPVGPGRRCVPRARAARALGRARRPAADATARRLDGRGRRGARRRSRACSQHEPPRATGRDPPARAGPGALDPGGARPGAARRGPRGRPDDRLPRRHGARARQGACARAAG